MTNMEDWRIAYSFEGAKDTQLRESNSRTLRDFRVSLKRCAGATWATNWHKVLSYRRKPVSIPPFVDTGLRR
jgi:hypothetical protein